MAGGYLRVVTGLKTPWRGCQAVQLGLLVACCWLGLEGYSPYPPLSLLCGLPSPSRYRINYPQVL